MRCSDKIRVHIRHPYSPGIHPSNAHSSCRLFWSGVPVRIMRPALRTIFNCCAMRVNSFFTWKHTVDACVFTGTYRVHPRLACHLSCLLSSASYRTSLASSTRILPSSVYPNLPHNLANRTRDRFDKPCVLHPRSRSASAADWRERAAYSCSPWCWGEGGGHGSKWVDKVRQTKRVCIARTGLKTPTTHFTLHTHSYVVNTTSIERGLFSNLMYHVGIFRQRIQMARCMRACVCGVSTQKPLGVRVEKAY